MASKRKAAEMPVHAGKTKFLVVLPEGIVMALKLKALKMGRGTTASSVLEDALRAWMKAHGNRKSAPEETGGKGELRQFLSQMDGGLIREVKIKAMDWKVTASAVVRIAARERFDRENKD